MSKIRTPLYRAKRKAGNEYIIGWLIPVKNKMGYFIRTIDEWVDIEIDPTTLAIHIHDMIDSQENKIFASLSKDGKGGDVVEYILERGKKAISVCRYNDKQIVYAQSDVKVIGIQI